MRRLVCLGLVVFAGCVTSNGPDGGGPDQAASGCMDGVKGGDETDVDCGGSCTPCAAGKTCLHPTDCASGSCVNNACVAGGGGDMAVPADLAAMTCINNAQCMAALAHATGACGPAMTCVIASCDPGYADCDKIAANGCEAALDSDLANCGACGTSCAMVLNGTGACMAGKCAVASCNAGFSNCDGLFATGCSVATASDVNNCGACSHPCAAPNGTPACSDGACAIASCNMGFADCNKMVADGCEANVATDPMNCGGCMKACIAPPNGMPACMAGTCTVGTCDFGFAHCSMNPADGCETNVAGDADNCGACGMKCPVPANATAGCKTGTCGIGMCNASFADCDLNPANGCETNTATDVSNCGGCKKACNFANGMGACLAGQCGLAGCNHGFTMCGQNPNATCVNLGSDPKNCGKCGQACPPQNPLCDRGKCVLPTGCADGTREGFADVVNYPTIASCAADFSQQSLRTAGTGKACGNSLGPCSAPSDACAAGWHLCAVSGWPGDLHDRITLDQCHSPDSGTAEFVAGSSESGDGWVNCIPLECKNDPAPYFQPICCGMGCSLEPNKACVWNGGTYVAGMTLGCNDYVGMHPGDGILCCKDPEIIGH